MTEPRLTHDQQARLKQALDSAVIVRTRQGWARSTFSVVVDNFIIERVVAGLIAEAVAETARACDNNNRRLR